MLLHDGKCTQQTLFLTNNSLLPVSTVQHCSTPTAQLFISASVRLRTE